MFAPTNDAFAALLTELGLTKAQLLADSALLDKVLKYHVVPGRVLKAGVPLGTPITTVQGETFSVNASLAITDQRGTQRQHRRHRRAGQQRRDPRHRQGDPARSLSTRSLSPHLSQQEVPTMKKIIALTALAFAALSAQAKDIVDTAVAAGKFNTLAAALQAAGLVDTLKGPGPFTVFAPTDEAFAKIPKADLDALLKDKAKLSAVLTYHVVAGKVMAKDVKAGKVKTVQGSELTLGTTGGVTVDAAKVIQADIVADNGVVHVIDSVVLPK